MLECYHDSIIDAVPQQLVALPDSLFTSSPWILARFLETSDTVKWARLDFW
jgi:hypothetical protein